MLTISLAALALLVLLLWASLLGKYWDRTVPGGAEGGWRRRFAVTTSNIWFPMGKDLWPLVLIALMFLFAPLLHLITFGSANLKPTAAAIGHVTIPGKIAMVKVLDHQSASVFDWEEHQKIIQTARIEKTEEIGGGIVLIYARDRGAIWKAISRGGNSVGDEVYIRTGLVRQGRENNNEPLYWVISSEEVKILLQHGFKLE